MDYLARGLKPGVSYSVQVRSQEDGHLSPWSPTFTFTAPLPPAPTQTPTITVTAVPMGYVVGVTGQASVYDFGGIYIYEGTTGVTGTRVATTTDSVTTVSATTFTLRSITAQFVDAFRQTGPFASQVAVVPINPIITDTVAPSTPSGLTVSQISVPSGAAGSVNGLVTKVQAYWNCAPAINSNGVMDIAGFRLRYGIASALPSVIDIPSNPVQPTQKQHAGTVASLTFAYHPYKVGDYVNVAISDAQFDGQVLVTGVTGTTGIVYTLGSSTTGLTSTTGWVIQNSVVLEGVRPNLSYDYSINSYDEQFNLSSFSASTSYTATATAALDTSGLFKLGVGVSGANDGLFINTNNYWFSGGAFSIGDGQSAKTTNFVPTPSPESGIGNWVTTGSGTITAGTTGSPPNGTNAFLMSSPDWNGAKALVTGLIPGATITMSAYIKLISSGLGIYLNITDSAGASLNTNSPGGLNTSTYIRASCTTTVPADGKVYVSVSKSNSPSGTHAYWFDSVMLEYGSSASTYIEGSMSNAYWSGAQWASPSIQSGGGVSWNGTNFVVDGEFSARRGTFSGNVEIRNGGTLFMQGGTGGSSNPIGTGQRVVLNNLGVQGFDNSNNAIFTLPTTGTAQIGGWSFGPSGLSAGSGATAVGMSPSNSGWSFWAGDSTPGSAPFRVSNAGTLFASSGTIAGISIINAFPALPNGNFESAIDTGTDNWNSFWKGAGATATRAAGEGVGGSYAYKVVVPASSGSTLEWTGTIPVVPGETYTLTAQVKASSVLTNSIIVGLLSGPTAFHTKFFDSQANWSATEYAIANSTTSFSTFTKAYTVPAGVYFIRPVVQMGMEGTASIRTFWVDNVTLTRSGSFNALVSGTGLPGSDTMKFMVADSGIISTTSKMAAIPGKFAMSGEINATSIEGSSMRAVEYKTLGVTAVAANQTTYSVLPDAGTGAGTTFVAPISGCVLVLVSAILQSQDAATVVSYEIRTGGTLGSGSVVVAAATENGAYASGGAGGVELMNTSGFQSNYVSGLTPNSTYNIRFMNYNADTVTRNIQYRKLTIIPQL